MTTQELVERLHDWIEDNAAIDWPYPTLPADRAEVLRAAASRLSEMEQALEKIAHLTRYAPKISGEREIHDMARAALEHQP